MKKIIFIFSEKFTQRDYIRFEFKFLRTKGYKIEAWESPSEYAKEYSTYEPSDPFDFDGHKSFSSISEKNKAMMNVGKNDIIIDLSGTAINNSFLSNTCKVGFLMLSQIAKPYTNKWERFFYRIKKIIDNPHILLFKMKNYFSNINRVYDFVIVGGELDKNLRKNKISSKTHIINAHSFDYDQYLKSDKYCKKKNIQNYALFIDEDMPNGADYSLLGIEPYVTIENYYNDLNRFFKIFEKSTGLEIIIAKHPRAIYKNNPYGNRKIVKDRIVELVKNSKLVMCHMSTALNFAVIYQKPIILLDSKKYNYFLRSQIKSNQKLFDGKVIDISNKKLNHISWNKVNKYKYNLYKQKYIKTPDTPERSVWEIFADNID